MLISIDSLLAHLASATFFTAFVPIILGGITYFHSWLISEESLRERLDLRKQVLLERANKRLHSVFVQVDVVDDLAELRGTPPQKPDLISDFTEDFTSAWSEIQKLGRIYASIRRCRTTFLVTAVIAIAGVLAALVIEESRPYVSLVCFLIIGLQIIVIFLVRRWTIRLDECEGRL